MHAQPGRGGRERTNLAWPPEGPRPTEIGACRGPVPRGQLGLGLS